MVVLVGQAYLIQSLTAEQLTVAQVTAAVVALNAALAAGAASTVTIPAELDPALRAAYFESYTVGFGAAMLVGAALCLGAAALAWFALPSKSDSTP